MGNICGCVRVPKEECYVDPKKAPLCPESKELKGRRYFQRKKRKSVESWPGETLGHHGRRTIKSGDTPGGTEPQDGPDGSTTESHLWIDRPSKREANLSRQSSISKGVYIGEVPVYISREPCNQPLCKRLACTPRQFSADTAESDRSRSSIEEKLHSINTTSRGITAKDGLLGRKLLQRQLRRAVSFGAVEHMLRTLRGNDRPGSEEAFSKIIWGTQVHRRRRRRAYTCSGYVAPLPASAKCSQPKVNKYTLFIAIMRVIMLVS